MKRLVTITLIFIVSAFGLDQSCFGQQRGGVLRMISANFPKNLYPPETGPGDRIAMLPVAERLLEWDEDGNIVPILLESWDEDPENNIIIYRLRKGIRFHDGTPLNAEAMRWNLQMRLEKGRLTEGAKLDRMEVIDEYTLRVFTKMFDVRIAFNYGFNQMISPASIEKNGVEWAQSHIVGTGPFKLAEFQRDTYIRYDRNDDYWQKGKPYLDAMENRYIPDPMSAAALIEAGQADVWLTTGAIPQIISLEKKGFKSVGSPGMFWAILPDTKYADSPFKHKKVREALEYAIDRPTLAMLIGQGKYEPLHQMAPSGRRAYVKGYNPRPYNPEKAKQLLKEAGYSRGFKTTLMARSGALDAVSAMKFYLAAVGIDVKLDIADLGRYFGSLFGTGWKGLIFAASGIDPDSGDIFIHFGPYPLTYRTGNIYKSPEYLAAANEALQEFDTAKRIKLIQKMVRLGGEDAMIIPIYRSYEANVMAKYVHSDYPKIHNALWHPQNDWMERH